MLFTNLSNCYLVTYSLTIWPIITNYSFYYLDMVEIFNYQKNQNKVILTQCWRFGLSLDDRMGMLTSLIESHRETLQLLQQFNNSILHYTVHS